MGSAQNFLSFLISFVVFFMSLPSLMAVLSLSVRLLLEFRKTHGVIPDAATPECPDPFFDSFCLFHIGPSLQHFVVSPYRLRFGVYTGKLIGSVQYFLPIFTFLAFSFMTIPP
jgi:hypothetical protein